MRLTLATGCIAVATTAFFGLGACGHAAESRGTGAKAVEAPADYCRLAALPDLSASVQDVQGGVAIDFVDSRPELVESVRAEVRSMSAENARYGDAFASCNCATRGLGPGATVETRPVVPADASVETIADGGRLILKPRQAKQLPRLRETVRGDVTAFRKSCVERAVAQAIASRPAPTSFSECALAMPHFVRARTADVAGGVSITFTGPPDLVARLRENARMMASANDQQGDAFAACACAARADISTAALRTTVPARASVDDIAEGAVLTLRAMEDGQIQALRDTTRADVTELGKECKAPGASGVTARQAEPAGPCPITALPNHHMLRESARDIEGGVALQFTGPPEQLGAIRDAVRALADANEHRGDPFAACACATRANVTSTSTESRTMVPASASVRDTSDGASLELVAEDELQAPALRDVMRGDLTELRYECLGLPH